MTYKIGWEIVQLRMFPDAKRPLTKPVSPARIRNAVAAMTTYSCWNGTMLVSTRLTPEFVIAEVTRNVDALSDN